MRESYQQRMLESKSNLVICDWDRATGKTRSIADFIVNKVSTDKPLKVLVVSRFDYKHISSTLHDELDDISKTNEFLQVLGRGFEKIIISATIDGKKYNLADISIASSIENSRGMKVDYVLCDEYIPSSNELNIFYSMGSKTVYSLGTFEIDYISDKEEINNDEWIEIEVNKLMREFSNIPNEENTTKRREIVLNMIQRLSGLKMWNK